MEKLIEIKECRSCPLFGSQSQEMYCGHPFWENKGYENMIITQDNIYGDRNGKVSIPEKCPLRKEYLTIYYKLVK